MAKGLVAMVHHVSKASIVSLAIGLALGPAVWAEHAKVELTVESEGKQQTAFVDQTPPEIGKSPRPVLEVRAGQPIRVQWFFQNVYPNKTLKDVVMHFYVARADKVGQKVLPDTTGEVELETAFDMDFKPGAKAGARSRFVIDKPGVYMVRVESRQTQSDHEHFAAIDLIVK